MVGSKGKMRQLLQYLECMNNENRQTLVFAEDVNESVTEYAQSIMSKGLSAY